LHGFSSWSVDRHGDEVEASSLDREERSVPAVGDKNRNDWNSGID